MWGMLPTFFCSTDRSRLGVKDALEFVVIDQLEHVGYDLVELRRGGTTSRPLIEVRIDRRDLQPVTIADCARVSRVLEERLDAGGLVPPGYVLEVSSPGERPLRTPAEWRRFVGQWVNMLAPEHGGRFEARILAVEGEAGSEVAVVKGAGGRGGGGGVERRIPLTDVREARLTFHL